MPILTALRYHIFQDVALTVSLRIKPIILSNSCRCVHCSIYFQLFLLEVIVSLRELNSFLFMHWVI